MGYSENDYYISFNMMHKRMSYYFGNQHDSIHEPIDDIQSLGSVILDCIFIPKRNEQEKKTNKTKRCIFMQKYYAG